MSATFVYCHGLLFGVACNADARIVNLPAGAKAKIILRNEEFARAEVVLANGKRQSWIIAEAEGGVRLDVLQAEEHEFDCVFRAIVIAPYLAVAGALYFLLWPVRAATQFLVDDWQKYRNELDELCDPRR